METASRSVKWGIALAVFVLELSIGFLLDQRYKEKCHVWTRVPHTVTVTPTTPTIAGTSPSTLSGITHNWHDGVDETLSSIEGRTLSDVTRVRHKAKKNGGGGSGHVLQCDNIITGCGVENAPSAPLPFVMGWNYRCLNVDWKHKLVTPVNDAAVCMKGLAP